MIKAVVIDFIGVFLNYIVSYIPCWTIRKVFYKLSGMKIGRGSRVLMGTKLQAPNHISIGEMTYINDHCHLDGRGGLTIGDNVNISNYSVIITASHDMKSDEFSYRVGSVVIEDYCWLGTRAMILDKSRLRRGTVIGAGSVFKGESEEEGVYVGVPAMKAKHRGLSGEYNVVWKPFFK